MKGNVLFAVTLIFASQLALAGDIEPFAVGVQKPNIASLGGTARPIVESGKLNQKLDSITKKRIGENALATLELSLSDQRKGYLNDKATLTRLQAEMKTDTFWRNTYGGTTAAFAVLIALCARYGIKTKGDLFGLGATSAVDIAIGGFNTMGYEAKRRSAMADAANVSAAIQTRLDLINKTEAKIRAARGQAQ